VVQGPDDGVDGTDDLAVFVERLAAAGSDDATGKAREQIRRLIASAGPPAGLRHLAEALAATLTSTPAPRTPTEDTTTVAAAMRDSPLAILQDFDASAVAGAVAALVGDGRRVIVTAATAGELAEVRAVLRPDVADRGLDVLPDLSPDELRQLRRLLVTGSPDRAVRASRQLPPADRVPRPRDVADLCARARETAPPGPAAAMVPELLGGIDRVRREAVTSVARYVHRSLRAMYPRADRQWAWDLLGELIYSRHRPAFDQLLEDTAQAVAALERARHLPAVAVIAPLPPGALAILRRYGEFLFNGGRARTYLRAAGERREALPILRLLRVDGRLPQTADDVRRGVEHLELGERLSRIDLGCAAVGIPAPRDERELTELADGLVRVAAAARSVGALRHDVLFLAADSPLAVPDVDTAEQVATAILHYAEHGTHVDARRRLDRMADELASACPTLVPTSEHEAAVMALRAYDAEAYAAAVDALGAARRLAQDARRQIVLLERLQANAPRLAAAWVELAPRDPAALGFVCLQPIEALLNALPETDSADVVIVLGAHALGVERLLVAAAAPRVVAVEPPGAEQRKTPSALSVLEHAAAPVIRGRAVIGRNVVPIAPRPKPRPDITVA
jgi:hypothetical protein